MLLNVVTTHVSGEHKKGDFSTCYRTVELRQAVNDLSRFCFVSQRAKVQRRSKNID